MSSPILKAIVILCKRFAIHLFLYKSDRNMLY
jgi:hypothetical protein